MLLPAKSKARLNGATSLPFERKIGCEADVSGNLHSFGRMVTLAQIGEWERKI
jgi:hypothetical protein